MKVKSSLVLQRALEYIVDGKSDYTCAAILSVETDMRYANNGVDIRSNAQKIFNTLRPAHVKPNNASIQEWWPKGRDPHRIAAINEAILKAKKAND